mmetsp:Transcript_8798/g.30103  ORF Transcript_8798/g.30103 Transcript_8798/m.30103 type:complete len:201 (+) Transcript_8798:108-710(+)
MVMGLVDVMTSTASRREQLRRSLPSAAARTSPTPMRPLSSAAGAVVLPTSLKRTTLRGMVLETMRPSCEDTKVISYDWSGTRSSTESSGVARSSGARDPRAASADAGGATLTYASGRTRTKWPALGPSTTRSATNSCRARSRSMDVSRPGPLGVDAAASTTARSSRPRSGDDSEPSSGLRRATNWNVAASAGDDADAQRQ